MGLHFEIDKRYSQTLVQIYIVFTFASGIPLLYVVGIVCLFMSYWTDKYLFLRLYRKPPLYDDGMAVRARSLLKFAILIHCLMSLYIYSNDEILRYQENNSIVGALRQRANNVLDSLLGVDLAYLERELYENVKGLENYMTLHKAHSLLYMLGLIVFACVVLLEEVFGVVSYIGRLFSLCLRLDATDKQLLEMWNSQLSTMKSRLSRIQPDGAQPAGAQEDITATEGPL